MTTEKSRVVTLAALADEVTSLHQSGKRVIHARGTFDLLDRHGVTRLRAARDEGQALVVTIAAGGGMQAPLLGPEVRAAVVAAVPFVHGVALEATADRDHVIETIGGDALVEMDVADAEPKSVQAILDATGRGDVVYDRRSPFTPQAEEFLREFRLRYTAQDVIASLESLRKLKILVVGDTIIDEYHFVRPYGMPLKAPIIASQFLEAEAYAGGILAVANHLAGFCDDVHLVTSLGETDSREEFVRSHLHRNVTPKFFYRPNAPTTVKRRYLIRFLVQKLFEVGFFDDRPLPQDVDDAVAQYLAGECAAYDLVVVADFGHGMLSEKSAGVLSSKARFLAVNTQLNSVNYGYHVITKYGRADYVCIDEPELRMATRDRLTPVEGLLRSLASKLDANTVTVTRGHHGSLTYRRDGSQVAVPILSREVIDTIGAGDAYLSITAPCVRMGFPPELVGFIGNAVGGLAVRIVGNKEPVAPDVLFQFINALME